jgi:ribonuclease HI
MLLFIDGSVNPVLKIGYGSHLIIPDNEVDDVTEKSIRQKIRSKKFSLTSSTKLEAQTLLWALDETEKFVKEKAEGDLITIFTDSQNLVGLPNRRARLESRNFKSRKDGKDLKNADLYKSIYNILDRLNCRFIKVSGHSKMTEKTRIERIFAQVDRSSRRALREHGNVNKT